MSSAHSPDGSYTEDPSTETTMQFKSRSTEFDDEFDDEEPLPTIGTCKALYPFEGNGKEKCVKSSNVPGIHVCSVVTEPFVSFCLKFKVVSTKMG